MKNWLPVLPGCPELAIAMTPSGYGGRLSVGRFSSVSLYDGPPVPSVSRQPLPVALGSPHWSTLMPSVTRRWHLLLSKKFLLARCVKLAAVHGAAARSTFAVIGPRLVSRVSVWMPVFGCVA